MAEAKVKIVADVPESVKQNFIRVLNDERAKTNSNMSQAQLITQWVEREYESRFGKNN